MNNSSITYFNCISDGKGATVCRLPEITQSEINTTLMKLPGNLPSSTKYEDDEACRDATQGRAAQRLDIFSYLTNETSIGTRLPMQLDDANVFKRLLSLQFLLIIGSKLEVPEESLRNASHMSLFKEELFNVSSLKVLALTIGMPTPEANTTDNTTWILPKNLQSFGVEKTLMSYDLRGCSKLQDIFVGSSPLTGLPALSQPPPPIEQLRFDGCPLTELKVEDVAVFCRLKNFSVVSFEEPFKVDMDKCECIRLLRWIRKLKQLGGFQFDGGLPCDENGTDVQLCPNVSLSEAIRLRKECLGGSPPAIIYLLVATMALPFVFAFSVIIRSFKRMHADSIRSPSSSNVSEMTPDSPTEEQFE